MLAINPISEDAKSVLRTVSKQATDGYTIQSKTGLSTDQLVRALQELLSQSVVSIEGDLNPQVVGKSFIWVPPGLKGYAQMVSGSALP
jgi:hypothetical protein